MSTKQSGEIIRFKDEPFYVFFTTITLSEGVYTIEFKQQYSYEQDLQNTRVLHTLNYPENTPLNTISEDYIKIKGYHGGRRVGF